MAYELHCDVICNPPVGTHPVLLAVFEQKVALKSQKLGHLRILVSWFINGYNLYPIYESTHLYDINGLTMSNQDFGLPLSSGPTGPGHWTP